MAKVMLKVSPVYTGYDVFIISGQSNASGRGTNNQTFTKTGNYDSLLFANDYTFKSMVDPTDSAVGQIDTISSDTNAAGSIWPLVATGLSAIGRKTIFVPCSKGGTGILSFRPEPDENRFDRATYYGSQAYRAKLVESYGGTLRCVLFWQGESDALNHMAENTYNTLLDQVANYINTDLGIKLMNCKLQNSSGIDDIYETAINNAIGTAWGDNVNVLTGPDLTDIGSDDDYHLKTDEKLATAAARWLACIKTAFSWS